MKFEWNTEKADANFKKHKVSFDEAKTVFKDPLFVIFADPDHSFEEHRFIIMGESDQNRLLVVCYAERPAATRLITAREATRREGKNLKKISEMDDEMRPEYDFSKLTVVARGSGRRKPEETTVALAPDVAKLFPTSEAVNEALRLLARVARESETRLG